MTLGFYHENADGALASERPKPAPCVIVFICPQPGVHRGTGHRPCGASQSWLNCWIQSSFGTEVCDITSGPLLGCQWPHGFGTGRALCWLAYRIALVRLFFGSVENMGHLRTWLGKCNCHVVFQELEMACFLTFYQNIGGDCCNPSNSFEAEWCT